MKTSILKTEAKECLIQIIKCIENLSFDDYTKKNHILSNSSIGEHTRHIIELFQQLLDGYEKGIIDYDKRKRNIVIQENIDFAIKCIADIISGLEIEDKTLLLLTVYNNQESCIETNFNREILYNLEHCIHHQAIIKIGLIYMGYNNFDENLGVAKSTIIYKREYVQ